MITRLEIDNLRGIRSARIDGLGRLTLITGRNGSGKSTVLDALLLACSIDPGDAVGRVVARHPESDYGARWLVGRDASEARVQAYASDLAGQACYLARDDSPWAITEKVAARVSAPRTQMRMWTPLVPRAGETQGEQREIARVLFSPSNEYAVLNRGEAGTHLVPFVRLVDPGQPKSLEQQYSEAVRAGRKDAVVELLSGAVGRETALEILTEEGWPSLHLSIAGGALPVALAGDGFFSLVHTLVEIAACPAGLVLLEEPEAFQHPTSLRQTARALVAGAERDIQIVATTHSLELISRVLDAVGESKTLPLDELVVLVVDLVDGVLRVGRTAGETVRTALEIGEDLR